MKFLYCYLLSYVGCCSSCVLGVELLRLYGTKSQSFLSRVSMTHQHREHFRWSFLRVRIFLQVRARVLP